MLNNHPRGLLAASMANMGERFGFYTMMAILVLFLQAKFGFDGTTAGIIYSVFYFSIYILAFVGGLIADKTRNYKGTILIGLVLMAVGYGLIAIPTETPSPNQTPFLILTCFGLFVIAFGNGLFKGNLQALVGKMYDNEQYSKMRDSGFSLFYMFINVGAIFAPLVAIIVRNWWVKSHGFVYNVDMPTLCYGQLAAKAGDPVNAEFAKFAEQMGKTDLNVFAKEYLDVFTTGFHYAFACAIIAMMISLLIFLANKAKFPGTQSVKASAAASAAAAKNEVTMDVKEVSQRIYALLAVFAVVIFFWFSFHQNGLTLTMFAKEFTDLSQIKVNLGFTMIEGAEVFQSFNPLFVVLLTPVVMAFFGWLRARGMEPSTPKKIAIGMGIAAAAYVVMVVGSYVSDLPLWSSLFNKVLDPETGDKVVIAIGTLPEAQRVTPILLIGTYLILTIAELFISPLGISFVSKVAPPQYQGLAQGGWLAATALGNSLLFIGAIFYQSIPIWLTWVVFVVACLLSMFTMIFMLKWLERIAK